MIQREPIYAEIFALLQAIPGVVTCSRILKHWADVPAEQQPALYLAQKSERQQTTTGEPTLHYLSAEIYVYVRTDGDKVPGTELNRLLDSIDTLFPQNPNSGLQTLNAAGVQWARVDGTIETDEGTLGQQAVAIVPILILAT